MGKAVRNLCLNQGTSHSAKKTPKTNSNSSSSRSLESKQECTGRWTRSGKRNPCPICDRTKDNKCAWNSETIHCYNGSLHYPPQDLKLGEVVVLEIPPRGRWALVAKNKGFSGNHWIFIPDKPLDKNKKLTPTSKEKVSPKTRQKINLFTEKYWGKFNERVV